MAFITRSRGSEAQEPAQMPKATAQFADNRTAMAAQLRQQSLMDSSPQAGAQRQLAQGMASSSVQQQKAIQRAAPEEELQMKAKAPAQLAGMEEEPLQGKFQVAQLAEDEDLLQGKFATAQLAEEDELLQGKFAPAQLAGVEEELPLQGKFSGASVQREEASPANKTGMPDNLKSGIENLSGHAMDDVKVHYNSSKPAELQAHAYAQGSDIHVGPGQEQHLPHEAWHVVQQKQGRVQPTMQAKGVAVNDDVGLESEADTMGAKALQMAKITEL